MKLSAGDALIFFFLILRPNVKGVGEDNVTHDAIEMGIQEVDGGVHLKIRRDVPGKTDGG